MLGGPGGRPANVSEGVRACRDGLETGFAVKWRWAALAVAFPAVAVVAFGVRAFVNTLA
jgi:hypothetical protein